MNAKICAVAAIGRNRELGKDGKLLWRIPDDLKRFKRLTSGHPIIMGRKTFESIAGYIGGPLPDRANIVVTRDIAKYQGLALMKDVASAGSIEDALEQAKALDSVQVSIGGGAEIYKLALPYTDKLCLTRIDAEAPADSFFPEYESEFRKKSFEETREWKGLRYAWVDLEREL